MGAIPGRFSRTPPPEEKRVSVWAIRRRIVGDTIKIFLIFCAVRIAMITNGFAFVRIPVLDQQLRYPISWLEDLTRRCEKFWSQYR